MKISEKNEEKKEISPPSKKVKTRKAPLRGWGRPTSESSLGEWMSEYSGDSLSEIEEDVTLEEMPLQSINKCVENEILRVELLILKGMRSNGSELSHPMRSGRLAV